MVADAGVQAIGLNFFAGSKRYVSPTSAIQVVQGLPSHVKRVGVFVNAPIDEIRQIAGLVKLDFVQLHGDEPPEFLAELADLQVIRAFRCAGHLDPVAEYLSHCTTPISAVLLDAYDPAEYGGTGKTLSWPDLANAKRFVGEVPFILAGGLTPQNVATAIEQANPFGVDTASGVEKKAHRQKDETLCRAFVAAAQAAFSAPR